MKIIDKYILKSYLKSLAGTFFVLMFIFFFHTIWLFIQELAGKDIGMLNILKFLFYYTPTLTYITLPLAVIVSSITTFGSLSENYEFTALKATGTSLLRAFRSVIVFMIFLSFLTFFIANNVIPIAEYKNYKFKYTISTARPSAAIVEGVFCELGEINIRVNKKYGEDGRYLKDIVIHKTDDGVNKIVIKAKDGEILNDKKNNYVQLILKNGSYYEDLKDKHDRYPHAKSYFKKYTINMDMSYLQPQDFDENSVVSTSKMMTFSQLIHVRDSLETSYIDALNIFKSNFKDKIKFSLINDNTLAVDSTNIISKNNNSFVLDSFLLKKNMIERRDILDRAIYKADEINNFVDSMQFDFYIKKRELNKYTISIHDKFSLAFACMILFFTGAPLGAIIRKGGIGMPMVIAIILFLSYYFIGLMFKNMAEEGKINAVFSSWIANIVMLPLGVVVVYKASSDRNLSN